MKTSDKRILTVIQNTANDEKPGQVRRIELETFV